MTVRQRYIPVFQRIITMTQSLYTPIVVKILQFTLLKAVRRMGECHNTILPSQPVNIKLFTMNRLHEGEIHFSFLRIIDTKITGPRKRKAVFVRVNPIIIRVFITEIIIMRIRERIFTNTFIRIINKTSRKGLRFKHIRRHCKIHSQQKQKHHPYK